MRKILIIALLSVLLISCVAKNDNNKNIKNNKKIEIKQKFWDITKFIKSDITDEESNKLQKILEDRKKIQKEIAEMIKNTTKENKDEVYKKILEKRTEIENEIIKYVSEDKKIMFKTYFEKYNRIIKKTLDNK